MSWMDLLNQTAAGWSQAMIRASWQGGLALAGAWVLCLVVTKLPPAMKCWVWRLAYVKLLVAGLWISPVLLPLLPSPKPRVAPSAPAHLDHASIDAVEEKAALRAPQPAPRPSLAAWLVMLWLTGAAASGVRLVREWQATIRLRHACHVINDAGIAEILKDLSQRLGLSHPPRVVRCDEVRSPLLIGIFNPAIVLPAWLPDESHARLMLAHELAHQKRVDLLWAWLPRIARTLFFFHPLVWLAERQWKMSQEMACDALAMTATRAAPADYGRALLAAARHACAAPALLAVGVIETRKTLERRLLAMRTPHHWSRRRTALSGVALLVIIMLGIVPWRVVAQEPARHQDPAGPATQDAEHPRAAGPTTKPARENGYGGILTARTVELRARTEGVLSEVRCREGEQVNEGSLLFEVNAARAKAAYDEAELEAQIAKHKYNHIAEQFSQHVISKAELDAANTEVETATATLAIKREERNETLVRAPFAGVVDRCDVVKGQTVTKNTVLATLVEADVLRVKFDVTVLAAMHLHLWDKFRVRVDMDRSEYFDGEVAFISPQVDPQSQTVSVKGTVKSAGGKLKPGMAVTVLVPSVFP